MNLIALAIVFMFTFASCSDEGEGSPASQNGVPNYKENNSSMVIEYYESVNPRYEEDNFLGYDIEYICRWYLNDELSRDGKMIFDVERIKVKEKMYYWDTNILFDSVINRAEVPFFYFRYSLEKDVNGYLMNYAIAQIPSAPGVAPKDTDPYGEWHELDNIVIKDGNIISGSDPFYSVGLPIIYEKISDDSYIFMMEHKGNAPQVDKKWWNKIDRIKITKK